MIADACSDNNKKHELSVVWDMPVPVLVDCICVCVRSLYWYACLTAPAKKNYCHTTLFLHALESVRLAKMSNQHSGKHKPCCTCMLAFLGSTRGYRSPPSYLRHPISLHLPLELVLLSYFFVSQSCTCCALQRCTLQLHCIAVAKPMHCWAREGEHSIVTETTPGL